MRRIFLLLTLLMLSACNRQPVTKVPLPQEVAAVTTPFLAAVKRGDQAAAEKFVAKGFVDDSRIQFAEMSAILKTSPPLVPAIVHRKADALGPSADLLMLTFATRSRDQWITSEMHLYERKSGNFQIQYWDVNAAEKPPELLAHARQMQQFLGWLMAGIAVMALGGLALLIWVVKRRTHIIAPEPAIETRRIAATVRDHNN